MASLLDGITGDEELIREFDKLPLSLEKKGLRPALRNATKQYILAGARSNLESSQVGGTGALSRDLRVRAVPRSRVKFGSQVELRAQHSLDTFYGLFLEFGLTKTSPPRRHKSGKSTGDLPAQPFLRPALYDNKENIRKAVATAVRKWLTTLKKTK